MNGTNLKIVSAIIIAACCLGIGATIRPEAFTYTKVYSVNGSDANAGCPMICRMNGTSNEKVCDCTGQIYNDTGFLVDGVIPTINVHQRNSWASMLYTVNTASTEHAIGFKFSHAFMVQEVELNIFLCPQWNILNTDFTIKIYSSHTFPAFTVKNEIPITTTSFLGMDNCNSSINVTIVTTSSNTTDTTYFIEFRSMNNLGEIYFGEVMFRDEVTSLSNISSLIETLVSTKIYNITSSELSVSSISISPVLLPTTTSIDKSSFLNMNQLVSITQNLELNTMSSDFITMVKRNTKSSHIVALIGGLIVVIVTLLLMLTIIGLLIAISTVRKKKNKKASLHHSIPRSKSDTTNFDLNNVINEDTEMNITNDYIATVQEKSQDQYNKINLNNKDKTPYEVPYQQYNELRQQHSVNKENVPVANCDVRNCPVYDRISVNLQTEEATYNEIKESNISDQVYSKITENKQTTTGLASPILQKDSVLQTLPDKSKDNSTDHIYSNPDDSMYFVLDASDSDDDVQCINDELHDTSEEESMMSCIDNISTPLYDLPNFRTSDLQTIPVFKPENIKKIKTIGTGYFGKVFLADTVNLSLKNLNLGEDEDQTKPIRVAVKQLKTNPLAKAIENFEKEVKFMSRLDHENVIKVLGSCKGSVTYIMMEYMEKGDLARYLVTFENFINDNEKTSDITISVRTLIIICSQIANGMKYLSSKNFVHRDLATRNCLVGNNMQVKIADFGMSRNLYQSHYYILNGGHTALPIRWMAKECFHGKFCTKSDVWAFGVTMWEIFTLAKDIPYEDMQDEELVVDATQKHPRTLLAKPTSCPANMYDVMSMCWKESSSDRATFETLYDILNNSL